MSNFIEVVDGNKKRHLINIQHIEEIVEVKEKECFIYLNVVCDNSQDRYAIKESYDVLKKLIEERLKG